MCTLNVGVFRPCRLMMPYLEPPTLTSFTVKSRSLLVSAWRGGGLWVTAQAEPGGLPKTNCPAPTFSVHFYQVRAPVHEGMWSDLTCPYVV